MKSFAKNLFLRFGQRRISIETICGRLDRGEMSPHCAVSAARKSLAQRPLTGQVLDDLTSFYLRIVHDRGATRRMARFVGELGLPEDNVRFNDTRFTLIRIANVLSSRKVSPEELEGFFLRGLRLEGDQYRGFLRLSEAFPRELHRPSIEANETLSALITKAADPDAESADISALSNKMESLRYYDRNAVSDELLEQLVRARLDNSTILAAVVQKAIPPFFGSRSTVRRPPADGVLAMLSELFENPSALPSGIYTDRFDEEVRYFLNAVHKRQTDGIETNASRRARPFGARHQTLNRKTVLVVDGAPDAVLDPKRGARPFVIAKQARMDGEVDSDRLTTINESTWYEPTGRRAFAEAYEAAKRHTAKAVDAKDPRSPSFLTMLVDRTAPWLILFDSLADCLDRADVRQVVVATPYWRLVAEVAEELAKRGHAQPIFWWDSRECPRKLPTAPTPSNCIGAGARVVATRRSVQSEIDALSHTLQKMEPAIVFGTLHHPLHRRSITNLLRELRERRPVLLVLNHSLDEVTVSEIELATRPSRADFGVHFWSATRGLQNLPSVEFQYTENSGLSNRLTRLAFDLEEGKVNSFTSLMHQIADAIGPISYLIYLQDRSARGTALNSVLRSRSVITYDAYIFTIANSARQLPSQADFLGLIDTVQAAYVEKTWNRSRSTIQPIGYLWATEDNRPRSRTCLKEVENSGVSNAILIATQSGMRAGNEEMIDRLAHALRDRPDIRFSIRTHPREAANAPKDYLGRLEALGIARKRCMVSEGPLDKAIQASDAVVTQTSNVAIEAAFAGKKVVKYLARSGMIAREILDTPYSINVFASTEDEEIANLSAALTDRDAATRLSARRQKYLTENPALAACDAASRIVDFLEERIASPSLEASQFGRS